MIIPDWPVPANVRSLITTRSGGVSTAPYASLNLGDHVGDNPQHVMQNRAVLSAHLPAEPRWLKQVHGIAVADACTTSAEADASVTFQAGEVCAVLTADCLPVLLCDQSGTVVGAAHAGWRGLLNGVIESTAAAMQVPTSSLLAYLGPAIGPQAFEVGNEVRAAFVAADPEAASAFSPSDRHADTQKWLADIYELARLRLEKLGVAGVFGGGLCTYTDAGQFFSYRREGVTGRMASLIWLEK